MARPQRPWTDSQRSPRRLYHATPDPRRRRTAPRRRSARPAPPSNCAASTERPTRAAVELRRVDGAPTRAAVELRRVDGAPDARRREPRRVEHNARRPPPRANPHNDRMKLRGFVLQATYRVVSDPERGRVPVIHVYGALEGGGSFLVRDDRQRPHFYVRTADAARAQALGAPAPVPCDRRTFAGE